MTIEDFFGAVGVIVLAVAVGCALWALVSWVAGFCRILYYDGKMVYLHSRMRRKLTALNGEYVSRWLINYSLMHGFISGNFTAWEWNEFFARKMKEEQSKYNDK